MNKRIIPLPSAHRARWASFVVAATVGLAGCGSASDEPAGRDATASDQAGAETTEAEELRNRLVEEGFPCDEGEKEEFEGRTLSQCESGTLLAVFDNPEAVPGVADNYVDNGEHVLRGEEWIVVDFQEESRLPRYQEALGGEIVEK